LIIFMAPSVHSVPRGEKRRSRPLISAIPLRQRPLKFVVEKIGRMDQARGLILNRPYDPG